MKAKLKALWNRLPKSIRDEAVHVALTFAVAFAASAKALIPALTTTPSFATLKALLFAAVAAGARAAIPVGKAALKKLVARALGRAF